MDPVTILSLLKALIGCVEWAFDAIEKVKQAEAAEIDALKKLKSAMSVVESDISFFKTMISALKPSENECFYYAFIQRKDVRGAMIELNRALRVIEIQLEAQQAQPDQRLPSISKSTSLRPVLESIIHLPHAERHSTVSDLNDITRNLLDNLQNAKRAFKLVWNLYTVSRQPLPINLINPKDAGASGSALDAIQWEFISHPFAIPPRPAGSHAPFSVLNRDHDIAAKKEELARRLGKDWIDGYVHGRNAPPSRLVEVQVTLFELFWSGTILHLKTNPTHHTDDPEYEAYQETLGQLDRSLQEVIARSQRPRFTLSFYGMVKAGKSLFLNAMIGKVVLPSDELPSTAWPCRLVHVKGQTQPELLVRTRPFNRALLSFRKHGYASKMQNYRPPTASILGTMVAGFDSQIEPSQEANELRNVYYEWMSLHLATRANLLEFEKAAFELPDHAVGVEGVRDLLGKINDIVRLCKRFGLRFDGTEGDWPVLSIEFSSLKDRNATEVYEFIDLPGIGEQFQNSNWEALVQLATLQSNVIVPIVSFMELSRSDWRDLPNLAASGHKRKPGLVVCTHLDRISQDNLQQQLFTVSNTFWPEVPNQISRVLKCSSLMGLSANGLLEQSETTKPPFKDVWEPKFIGYHCASKILGEGDPEWMYNHYDRDRWRVKVEQQLDASGVPHVLQKLTRDLVDNARESALINETENVIHLLRELRKRESRKLLEARRTQDEFETAKREYDETRRKFQMVLETWDWNEQEQINTSRRQLQNAHTFISRKAEGLIQSALRSTLYYWDRRDPEDQFAMFHPLVRFREFDGTYDLGNIAQFEAEITQKVLEVESVLHAQSFLDGSQRVLKRQLYHLKREYVDSVRRLGEEAKSSRINALRTALQSEDDLQTELRDDVIAELKPQSTSIQELAYSQIKKEIKISSTRYTAKTAFQTIEAKIARWWLNPTPYHGDELTPWRARPSSFSDRDNNHMGDDSPTHSHLPDDDNEVEEAARRSIEKLGFMLRAPLTAITSIAWTVSAPIWVFIPKSRIYHLSMMVIQQQYKDKIVQPWLESLKNEGEKSLLGIIDLSSNVARYTLNSALEREEIRYTREVEAKRKPPDDTTVDNMVTAFVNLLAAEEALQELNGRIGQR